MGLSSFIFVQWAPKDASFLQQSDDGEVELGHCVNEMFHHTVNASRLRTESVHRSWTTYRRPADDINVDDDTDEVVYVADIAETNLLLVVVDGRRSVNTSTGTTHHRQVVPLAYSSQPTRLTTFLRATA